MRIRAGDDYVVVFAGKVFRYPRGDEDGRAEAMDYGRAMGVPEHQPGLARLSWHRAGCAHTEPRIFKLEDLHDQASGATGHWSRESPLPLSGYPE